MKKIREFFLPEFRKNSPVCRQMELPLPGTHLTRDETNFLRDIRRLREEIAGSRG